MKYLTSGFLAIVCCLFFGCNASEEQAHQLIAATHPKSAVILYEAEGMTGHYYLCQSNVVIYVRTFRNQDGAKITKTTPLPDTVQCGQ